MAEQAGDVVEADAAQLPRRIGVEEGVAAVGAHQRLQQVQAGAVASVDRLGHEGGVEAVLLRDVLDDETERADVVGGDEHVVLAEIDLVLRGGDLVVRRLDVDADRLEGEHDLPAHVFAEVDRGEVEVAGGVVGLGGRPAVARLEQEELGLGAAVHRVAGGRRAGDSALQGVPGTALERAAVWIVDVADQPADALAGRRRPRQDAERRQVRTQEHVRLLDPDEAFDGRAVEHDLAVQRRAELPVRDLDVLDHAEDVGELQAHELHVRALGELEDLRLAFGAAGVGGRGLRVSHAGKAPGGLAARGERAAAFAGRCIPALGVARRSNMPHILPPRALIAGRLARLGARAPFTAGCRPRHRPAGPLRRLMSRTL